MPALHTFGRCPRPTRSRFHQAQAVFPRVAAGHSVQPGSWLRVEAVFGGTTADPQELTGPPAQAGEWSRVVPCAVLRFGGVPGRSAKAPLRTVEPDMPGSRFPARAGEPHDPAGRQPSAGRGQPVLRALRGRGRRGDLPPARRTDALLVLQRPRLPAVLGEGFRSVSRLWLLAGRSVDRRRVPVRSGCAEPAGQWRTSGRGRVRRRSPGTRRTSDGPVWRHCRDRHDLRAVGRRIRARWSVPPDGWGR